MKHNLKSEMTESMDSLYFSAEDKNAMVYNLLAQSSQEKKMKYSSSKQAWMIAAIITLLFLMAGCTYAALTGAQWFQYFFLGRKGSPLSQGQINYINQNTNEIGQSITVNGYTVTVESAIAEPRTAYIKLRLEAPSSFTKEYIYFEPRWTSEDHQFMEKFFFKKGNSPTEHSPFRADFQYDDPVDNTISILVRLDLTQNQDAPPIEVGTPYILHLTDLTENDWGEPIVVTVEGEWDFEIVFDHLNDTSVELISQPIAVSANSVCLNLTSLRLGTMSMEASFESVDPADNRYMACLAFSTITLKDGTTVSIHPVSFDPNGKAGLSLDSPIDLIEVAYIELRDGTQISMQ